MVYILIWYIISCFQKEPTTTTASDDSYQNFIDYHGNNDDDDVSTAPVKGFHLKLERDTAVNPVSDTSLKYLINAAGDDTGLFYESGLSNIDGIDIFNPSNGFYLLSSIVHVRVKPQESQEPTQEQAVTTMMATAEEPEKAPRVTLTICINSDCGNSA